MTQQIDTVMGINRPPMTAVIIKGNPKYIDGNPLATAFYNEIRSYLLNLGYTVSMDPGEPFTQPIDADLWIGHSRGCDRLQYAPSTTHVIAFGSNLEYAVNHPQDHAMEAGDEPKRFHFIFTQPMKLEIKKHTDLILNEKRRRLR